MLYDDTPIAKLLDSTRTKPRLLLVDDQSTWTQAMHALFAADFHVLLAHSGEQALAICQDSPPDLVLLDAVMPAMDGFEVCARLKASASSRDIPVIFVTGHNDTEQETRALNAGAADCVARPLNPAVVKARVKSQLMLKLQSDAMNKLVFLDGLTGVFNRRYFDQRVHMEMARSVRNKTPLALIMIELDFFDRYKDCYGDDAGDQCLREIADTLKAGLRRPADLVARYAGAAFACLLPETEFNNAMAMACELELRVRGKAMAHARSDAADVATITLGVAGRVGNTVADARALLTLAQGQLGRAVDAGRGRVSGDLLPSTLD